MGLLLSQCADRVREYAQLEFLRNLIWGDPVPLISGFEYVRADIEPHLGPNHVEEIHRDDTERISFSFLLLLSS